MDLIRSFFHPEEVYALLKFKLGGGGGWMSSTDNVLKCRSPELRKCYEYLNKTSRSFAQVILSLDDELRDAVCIFYLVLRALDTVEDDMSIPLEEKTIMLRDFHKYLEDPSWNYTKSKDKDAIVLDNFTTISAQFQQLKPAYREVIADICRRMGAGMKIYLTSSIDTIQQLDEYCHYVAGLVGIGLSKLFSDSGLEERTMGEDTTLSNSMGLFLHKISIIRDYLEDVLQGRQFWPKEVWNKYCNTLMELSEPERSNDALACLNELITNALSHIPDVIKYLGRIQNQSVFNFCAIPQLMAMATLERSYNNQHVFHEVIKIRKGEAIILMMQSSNIENVKAIFSRLLRQLKERIPRLDPSALVTHQMAQAALDACPTQMCRSNTVYLAIYLSVALVVIAVMVNFWTLL